MKPTAASLKEYARRRSDLMKRIGRDGVAIVPGSREVVRARDTHYRFRQDSDFKYLSGFVEPDAVLVIGPGRKADGHAAEFVMFVRARDPDMAIWHGGRAGTAGAGQADGAEAEFTIAELAPELHHNTQTTPGRES